MSEISEFWRLAEIPERKRFLQRAFDTKTPITTELLDDSETSFDGLGKSLKFDLVWYPSVDAAGLTIYVPGLVHPSHEFYRKREPKYLFSRRCPTHISLGFLKTIYYRKEILPYKNRASEEWEDETKFFYWDFSADLWEPVGCGFCDRRLHEL